VPCAISIKHASSKPQSADGMRVLVEGRWPAGLRKDVVAADLWLKEAAPSERLRRWYSREPDRWLAFVARYRAELCRQPDLLRLLDELHRSGPLTLLHGRRDGSRSYAVVVRDLLQDRSDSVRSRDDDDATSHSNSAPTPVGPHQRRSS
jgi:uncharacterized protein YeaO (DUF488 family)